jgi:ribonuclease BN (tRNA processing enzyme)
LDIRILGAHNFESQTTRCACFLIDDSLAIDAGGLTSGLSVQDQQRLDTILITHQHYDHIRDIPGIALSRFQRGTSVDVYGPAEVLHAIESHLLNGDVYPEFQKIPHNRPTVCLKMVKPLEPQHINGHKILPVPVNHSCTTLGYQISDKYGRVLFYTADTSPGLSHCWKNVSPQFLIIDVTLPNESEDFARDTGHLTPNLLEKELIDFRNMKGYLPQVMAVHMDPGLEATIREEIAIVAENLHIPIIVAYEGLRIRV